MAWPMITAAALQAAPTVLKGIGRYLGNKDKGEMEFKDPYGSVDMANSLRPLLKSRASSMSRYGDKRTEPITDFETANVSRANLLGEQINDYGSMIMKGDFPEEYYQKAIYDPTMKRYKEDIAPLVEEQFAGPGGGYWGTARANAMRKGYRDVFDSLASERAKLGYQAKYEAPLNYMKTAPTALQTVQNLVSVPRLVKQAGLDREYEEYVRGRQEMKSYTDQALNFFNLASGGAGYMEQPPEENPWAYAATVGADLVSKIPIPSVGGGSTNQSGGSTNQSAWNHVYRNYGIQP